jgi:DNA polymerase-3 subunit beta
MKITILKEGLNNGLNIVGRLAGKNLTLPILNNVLLATEGNFLNLSSTDLELGIKYWVLIKTEKEGKITVPARVLSGFVGFLPEKKITLETKNQVLHIDCENHKTQIKGLSAEDYPIIPKIEDENPFELNALALSDGITQVVDFSAVNQARPELGGVYFNFQKDKMQLTATDSFRLAEKTLYFEKKKDRECSFILPQKTAREFVNILAEKKGKVKLFVSPNQVMFECPMAETSHPQTQIISRLIEGEYPDYQGIVPKKYEIQALLPKNEFLNQIKLASIFSGKGNEVKIKVNAKTEGVEISSQNPECGENKSFLSGSLNFGPSSPKEMEIIFNYRFLLDGLQNIKSSRVLFDLNGEEGPAVLRPEADQTYLYVVMPIKTT